MAGTRPPSSLCSLFNWHLLWAFPELTSPEPSLDPLVNRLDLQPFCIVETV